MASDTTQASSGYSGTLIRRTAQIIGEVFAPLLPAIVAASLLMGLTEGLDGALGGSLQMSGLWILLHTFASASLIFLQILIGFSAARVFGGNEFLGGVVGMIMNHTSLINAWSIPTAVHTFGADAYQTVGSQRAASWLSFITGTATTASDASTGAILSAGGIPQVQLGFLNVTLQGFQGHVIPVILAVYLMCRIEQWLHAHVPDMLDLFVTPFATILATGLFIMVVLGPLLAGLENIVVAFFRFLLTLPFGIGGAIAGAGYPLTVVMGLHHMLNALEAELCAQSPAYDTLSPIISAALVAQGAACLGICAKTASSKRFSLALPSGLTALFGVGEPALFGVNLPAPRVFTAGMAGGAAGGIVSSLMNLHSNAYGVTGLFGYATTSDALGYTVVLLVSSLVALASTLLLYENDAHVTTGEAHESTGVEQVSPSSQEKAPSQTEHPREERQSSNKRPKATVSAPPVLEAPSDDAMEPASDGSASASDGGTTSGTGSGQADEPAALAHDAASASDGGTRSRGTRTSASARSRARRGRTRGSRRTRERSSGSGRRAAGRTRRQGRSRRRGDSRG